MYIFMLAQCYGSRLQSPQIKWDLLGILVVESKYTVLTGVELTIRWGLVWVNGLLRIEREWLEWETVGVGTR